MGQLIGLTANIFAQVLVLRYLFVFYFHDGDKSKYEEKKIAYIILFIVIGTIIYTIISALAPLIAIVFGLAMIYFAITMSVRWRDNVILPDPFTNANKSDPKDNTIIEDKSK